VAAEGALRWNFWDVKGGFQNVREKDVLSVRYRVSDQYGVSSQNYGIALRYKKEKESYLWGLRTR